VPELAYARLLSVPCLVSALLTLLGAVGPWVRIGPFALWGFDGVGIPLALLAGVAVGISALQFWAQRRSFFVALAILGGLALGGCVIAWTVLEVFSSSAHSLLFALGGSQHEAMFQSHVPRAAWGLWLLSLCAASLVALACSGAAMAALKPASARPAVSPLSDTMPPVPVLNGRGDHVPTRWR
jgi:hypothetical protein